MPPIDGNESTEPENEPYFTYEWTVAGDATLAPGYTPNATPPNIIWGGDCQILVRNPQVEDTEQD